jgi:hypothetical protein
LLKQWRQLCRSAEFERKSKIRIIQIGVIYINGNEKTTTGGRRKKKDKKNKKYSYPVNSGKFFRNGIFVFCHNGRSLANKSSTGPKAMLLDYTPASPKVSTMARFIAPA